MDFMSRPVGTTAVYRRALIAMAVPALLACCQTRDRNSTVPESHDAIRSQLERTLESVPAYGHPALPITFTYVENKVFTGDSATMRLSRSLDTLSFTYASRFDGTYPSVGIWHFKEFKVYQVEPGKYEVLGLFTLWMDDYYRTGKPKNYSLNLLAIPASPLPKGEYRFRLSRVTPQRFAVTSVDTTGKVIHQDPDHLVQESWTGEMRISTDP